MAAWQPRVSCLVSRLEGNPEPTLQHVFLYQSIIILGGSDDDPQRRSTPSAIARLRQCSRLAQSVEPIRDTMTGSSDDDSPIDGENVRSLSPVDETDGPRQSAPDNSSVPKPKRLACMICR